MDGGPTSDPGFSDHVQSQLEQAAHHVSTNTYDRGRGRGRGRGHGHGHGRSCARGRGYRRAHHDDSVNNNYQARSNISNRTGLDSFSRPNNGWQLPQFGQHISNTQQVPIRNPGRSQPATAGLDFINSEVYGSQIDGHYQHRASQNQFTVPPNSHPYTRPNDFNSNATQWQHASQSLALESPDERAWTLRVAMQSEFLGRINDHIARHYQLGKEEQDLKEVFRLRLEALVKDALSTRYEDSTTSQIKLKSYGSLANGFGLMGSDMDLLLFFPEILSSLNETVSEETLQELKVNIGRILEAAMLDVGIGARLLSNTRVPILRVCESPSKELLQNLRSYRATWDNEEAKKLRKSVKSAKEREISPPDLTITEIEALTKDFMNLNANEIPLPSSPTREQPNLEFLGDCGVQCDVNFSNYVAIYNTRLLRRYAKFDERVRPMGVFVKAWAKLRDINTPYRGTLSSYGYILMLLHFLMNVARPPLIPNLQELARKQDEWAGKTEVPLFEGFDVRFLDDEKKLALWKENAEQNQEPIGRLLRGFFWYYASATGFHWNKQVISIRTKGGILTKQAKKWTEAKWSADTNKNIRLRYLLAIEDPFEVDHNVARTVGHNGIVAIRDEFRRAWTLIAQTTEKSGDDAAVEAFLEQVTDRGDTLRKDQEFRKHKMKQMRQELEAKEEALRSKGHQSNLKTSTSGTLNNSKINPDLDSNVDVSKDSLLDNEKLTLPGKAQEPTVSTKRRKRKRDAEKCAQLDKVETPQELKADSGKDSEAGSLQIENHRPIGFDSAGNPTPWKSSTNEGKWLIWRDFHIRKGAWHGNISDPTFKKLDSACPYDARRPFAEGPAAKPFAMKGTARPKAMRDLRNHKEKKERASPEEESKNQSGKFEGHEVLPVKREAAKEPKVLPSAGHVAGNAILHQSKMIDQAWRDSGIFQSSEQSTDRTSRSGKLADILDENRETKHRILDSNPHMTEADRNWSRWQGQHLAPIQSSPPTVESPSRDRRNQDLRSSGLFISKKNVQKQVAAKRSQVSRDSLTESSSDSSGGAPLEKRIRHSATKPDISEQRSFQQPVSVSNTIVSASKPFSAGVNEMLHDHTTNSDMAGGTLHYRQCSKDKPEALQTLISRKPVGQNAEDNPPNSPVTDPEEQFEWDPMQLRDIEIIKRGGNACLRPIPEVMRDY